MNIYLPANQHGRKNHIHTQEDLARLLSKAEKFVGSNNEICHTFYRDKNSGYFDDISVNKNGDMQVCRKDHHGDPKSPINGRINGLFFSTNVQYGTTEPIPWSVFGNTRLLIPMEQLYSICPNLWFADFYCIHEPHIVTLVMTEPNSETDEFCREHLVQLNWHTNRFFSRALTCKDYRYNETEPIFRVTTSGVFVEVFFTEGLNICRYLNSLRHVDMRGQRSGGGVGLKKDPDCGICNI